MARKNIERYFPATLLFIDGDHENFDMLDELPRERKFGGSVGVGGENIFWLRRGEIYEIAGRRFLCFDGALGVDKAHRIPGLAGGYAKFRVRRSLLARCKIRAISSPLAGE